MQNKYLHQKSTQTQLHKHLLNQPQLKTRYHIMITPSSNKQQSSKNFFLPIKMSLKISNLLKYQKQDAILNSVHTCLKTKKLEILPPPIESNSFLTYIMNNLITPLYIFSLSSFNTNMTILALLKNSLILNFNPTKQQWHMFTSQIFPCLFLWNPSSKSLVNNSSKKSF